MSSNKSTAASFWSSRRSESALIMSSDEEIKGGNLSCPIIGIDKPINIKPASKAFIFKGAQLNKVFGIIIQSLNQLATQFGASFCHSVFLKNSHKRIQHFARIIFYS
jgi:hypothetical protein